MSKRWTIEEETLAIKLQNEGMTAKEIALQLPGRTPASVRARLPTKTRKWTEEEIQIIKELRTTHKLAYIAKVINRTQSAISTYIARNPNKFL